MTVYDTVWVGRGGPVGIRAVHIDHGWMGGPFEQRSSVADEADKGKRLIEKAIWVLA
jgi:tRNA(Ile)-lysidine synthase TilS/MesJ